MNFWTAIIILAIIGALVSVLRSRREPGGGGDTNATGHRGSARGDDAERDAREAAAQAEIAALKERIAVLERIATDAHSTDARERARITAEIEALRGPDEATVPHSRDTTAS